VSRRRRAVLLLGLALTLGGLAASDVARREGAIARQLGPAVPVLVAHDDIPAGTRLTGDHLAVRRVPARYAPPGAVSSRAELVGQRTAVPVPGGAYLSPAVVGGGPGQAAGPAVRVGERVAEVVAAGSPELIAAGSRVDVLVTRDPNHGGAGQTALALEDVEVLASAPGSPAGGADAEAGTPRVRASLRVTVRQAVYLAAAQSFARELRLLPRALGDRGHGAAGTTVDATLG
jgi:pilus assembly protein CpaB